MCDARRIDTGEPPDLFWQGPGEAAGSDARRMADLASVAQLLPIHAAIRCCSTKQTDTTGMNPAARWRERVRQPESPV